MPERPGPSWLSMYIHVLLCVSYRSQIVVYPEFSHPPRTYMCFLTATQAKKVSFALHGFSCIRYRTVLCQLKVVLSGQKVHVAIFGENSDCGPLYGLIKNHCLLSYAIGLVECDLIVCYQTNRAMLFYEYRFYCKCKWNLLTLQSFFVGCFVLDTYIIVSNSIFKRSGWFIYVSWYLI